MRNKKERCLRIFIHTINGLGQTAKGMKEINLKSFASNFGVGILGIQETNV